MFRLLRFLFSATVLVLLAYVVLTIPLGDKTLWGRLVDISKTDEAAVLKEEIEKKVDGASSNLKNRAMKLGTDTINRADASKQPAKQSPAPAADMSDKDRRQLKALIETKNREDAKKRDRVALDALIHEKRRDKK